MLRTTYPSLCIQLYGCLERVGARKKLRTTYPRLCHTTLWLLREGWSTQEVADNIPSLMLQLYGCLEKGWSTLLADNSPRLCIQLYGCLEKGWSTLLADNIPSLMLQLYGCLELVGAHFCGNSHKVYAQLYGMLSATSVLQPISKQP